jgi:hypothetical protein
VCEDSCVLVCKTVLCGDQVPKFQKLLVSSASRRQRWRAFSDNLTLNVKRLRSSRTLGTTHPTAKRHIPQDLNPRQHRWQTLRSWTAVGCGNRRWQFQMAVLTNRVEYRRQRNYGVSVVTNHLIYAFHFLKITSSKWSAWHAVHSHNCDWKVTMTLQQMFTSGCNFNCGTLFHSVTCHKKMWWYSELKCNWRTATSGACCVPLSSYG